MAQNLCENALVVIPTYNEMDNIAEMIKAIRSLRTECKIDILVVDSNSPDGTGQRVEELRKSVPGLYVLHQARKLGLGRAYRDGFSYYQKSLRGQYQAVVTMDADFSHNPKYLPAMLENLNCFDLVVGSRYVAGGGLENWTWKRKWVSRFGNAYARILTGLSLHDLTSGFHCFRAPVLEKVLLQEISAEGYAFLMELKFRMALEGFKILEIPVVVADRAKGVSKISKKVILESAFIAWKIFFQRWGHVRHEN